MNYSNITVILKHAWFLEIIICECMHVYAYAPEAINN